MDCKGCEFQDTPKAKSPCFDCEDGCLWWPKKINDENILRKFIKTLTNEQINLLKHFITSYEEVYRNE